MEELNKNQEDLKQISTDEEINKIIEYINKHFDNNQDSISQYKMLIKLSEYIRNNNITIGEIEAEKILEKSQKLNDSFNKLHLGGILVRVYSLLNLSTLLEMYVIKNFIEIKADIYESIYDQKNKKDIDLLKLYMSQIKEYKILTKEEIKEIMKLKHEEKINKLVTHNLRLVVWVAKKYDKQKIITLLDLIQFGNEGLMIAAKRFDETKGYEFSTYATWWINQSIRRGIANTSRMIRVPSEVHGNAIKIQKAIKEYETNNMGQEPTIKQIQEMTGLSIEKIQNALDNDKDVISLSTPLFGDENDGTLENSIEDTHNSIEKKTQEIYTKDLVSQILNSDIFLEREIEVIKYRYGFYGKIYTLQEIANIYNITPQRIRLIEANALRKAINIYKKINYNQEEQEQKEKEELLKSRVFCSY